MNEEKQGMGLFFLESPKAIPVGLLTLLLLFTAIWGINSIKAEKAEQQQEQIAQAQLVANELGLDEKKVRYDRRDRAKNIHYFRTEIGVYSVQFENNKIKSILKDEETYQIMLQSQEESLLEGVNSIESEERT